MKNWIFTLLIFAVTIGVLILLDPPFWMTWIVILPLLIIVQIYIVQAINSKAALTPQPVPEKGYDSRLAHLESEGRILQSVGFEKIDFFLLKTVPDCVISVFKHRDYPVFCCIYNHGSKKYFDLTTLYKDPVDLTSSPRVEAGSAPRPPAHFIQIVENADYGFLLDEHLKSIRFLRSLGLEPIDIPAGDFRSHFLRASRSEFKYLESNPFFPILLLFRHLTRHGKNFMFPIEEQARRSPEKSKERNAIAERIQSIIRQAGSTGRFRIWFAGETLPGFPIDRVKDGLAALFKTDRSRIEPLFTGRSVSIKKDADEQTARRYQNAFRKTGAVCRISSLSPAADTAIPERASMPIRGERAGFRFVKRVEKEEKIGIFAYTLAFCSFIPMYGLPIGVFSIILGLVKRKIGGWKIAMIGAVGILLTAAMYGGAWFFGLKQRGGVADDVRKEMARKQLTELVEKIEIYKLQNGAYPDSLNQLQGLKGEFVWIIDAMDVNLSSGEPRPYYYERDPSDGFYFLQSPGIDGVLCTQDDVFPEIGENKSGGLGHRRKI